MTFCPGTASLSVVPVAYSFFGRRRFRPSCRFTWNVPPFWVVFASIRHSFHCACSASMGTRCSLPRESTSIRYCSFVVPRERTSITPPPSFGTDTTRPSTWTVRDPRIARASRAVSQYRSMSRRTSPIGMASSIPCGSGEGLRVQKAVFRSIFHDRGAGRRFRCFLTRLSAPQQLLPPSHVGLVERHEDQVRGVDGPRDLLLVRLLDLDPLDRDRALAHVHADDLPLPAAELPPRDEDLVPLPHGNRSRDLPIVLLAESGVDVGREGLVPHVPRRLRRLLPLLPRLC